MNFQTFHETKHSAKPLNEAVFSENNITKAIDLMSRIIERKLGSKFYSLGFEDFQSELHGKGKGLRIINQSGVQIRFNWTSTKSEFPISGIDFWKAEDKQFTNPYLSVKFSAKLNIIKVIDKVIHDVKRSKTGRFRDDGTTASDEASGEYFEIFLGTTETNSLESSIQKFSNEFERLQFSSLESIYEDLEDSVGLVCLDYRDSMIIAGGKGFTSKYSNKIESKAISILGNNKVVILDNFKSADDFYTNIFKNRDKLIILKGFDSYIEKEDYNSLLNSLVQNSGVSEIVFYGNENKIFNASSSTNDFYNEYVRNFKDGMKAPSRMSFSGNIILISDKDSKEIGDVLRNKTIFCDVALHRTDILRKLKTAAQKETDSKIIDEIIDTLTPDVERANIEDSFITAPKSRNGQTIKPRMFCIAKKFKEISLPNWGDLSTKFKED